MSATQSTEPQTTPLPHKSNGKGGKHRKRRSPAEMAAAQAQPAREAAPVIRTAPTVKPQEAARRDAKPSLLVQGLFESFPQMADIEAAKDWLDTAAAVLKMSCRFPGSLTVTAAA